MDEVNHPIRIFGRFGTAKTVSYNGSDYFTTCHFNRNPDFEDAARRMLKHDIPVLTMSLGETRTMYITQIEIDELIVLTLTT